MAQGPGVPKVRSLTEIYGLGVSVEYYVAPKARCNVSAASLSATRSLTVGTEPGAPPVGAPTSAVVALPRKKSLSAVAVGETTRRTTVAE